MAKAGPRMELRPAFHFRHHETSVNEGPTASYKLAAVEGRYEIASSRGRLPPLRMKLYDCESAFTIAATSVRQVVYRMEQSRGYAHEGDLWSPGFFHVDLGKHETVTLVGSTGEMGNCRGAQSCAGAGFREERRARACLTRRLLKRVKALRQSWYLRRINL